MALPAERALPSVVIGPVDNWALAVLATICASVVIDFSPHLKWGLSLAEPPLIRESILAWACKETGGWARGKLLIPIWDLVQE